MDAGEQPSLAPLQHGHAGGKAAAQHEPFVLERAERELDVRHGDAEGTRQLGGRGGAHCFEPPAHQLAQRVFTGPALRPFPLGRRERRLARNPGEHGLQHRYALGRDPQGALRQEPARPALPCQLLEMPLPIRIPQSAIANRYGPHHQQRVMQLVRARDLRPRFFPHAIDRILVEFAEVVGRLDVEAAARDHRLSAALFQRGVVQERVGLGVEHLVGQR